MEWPSPRVDAWAIASTTIGVGFLAVPDTVTLHQLRFAIIFWVAALLIFACGFPAVQRQLRIVWSNLVTFYRRAAVSRPRGAPIVVALGIVAVIILLFGGGWWLLKPKINCLEPQLTVESINDPRSSVFGNKQDSLPKVSKFAQIKVTNVGKKRINDVKVIVTKLNDIDCRFQLPLSSLGVLFKMPNPSPIRGDAFLNPGDDQHFYTLVECNGMVCPGGELAIPVTENSGLRFATSIKGGVTERINSLTVRVSGDGAIAVTKTFMVSLGPKGQLLLKSQSSEQVR
jgi:hypothetical protein